MPTSSRRDFLKTGAAVVAGAAMSKTAAGVAPGKPNLLILHTDQQSSWSLSIYARRLEHVPNYGKTLIDTPHTDRIGREGAMLTNFIVNSAVCTPSRGCLFTGRYPLAHGAYRNNIELNRDEITIAEQLKRHGYRTGYAGKWHLDGPPKPGFMKPDRSMGFDDCRYMFNRGHWKKIVEDAEGNPSAEPYSAIGDEKTFTTDYLATKTIDFIKRERTRPWCYCVSFPDPHTPFTVRKPYDTMYDEADMVVPATFVPGLRKKGKGRPISEADVRRRKAQYCGEVKCIDDNVGRILRTLETTGQINNTIVVFTTDHGEYMGEHGLWGKNQWYRTAYQVPFLVRWPKRIKPNTIVDRFITSVDVAPTLLGLMGMPKTGREQGSDVSALLAGGEMKWADEAQIHHSSLQGAGIFTPTYELVLKNGGGHMLFHRPSDPEQKHNLATDPKHQDAFMALAKKIADHHRAVESPVMEWLDLDDLQGGLVAEPGKDGAVYQRKRLAKNTLAKGSAWNRILTTPKGLFKPNSEYVVEFDYRSHGLGAEDAAFYYTLRPGNDRKNQIGPIRFRAAEGESGHKEQRLSTGDRDNYALILGIYKKGSIVIENLRIRKVE